MGGLKRRSQHRGVGVKGVGRGGRGMSRRREESRRVRGRCIVFATLGGETTPVSTARPAHTSNSAVVQVLLKEQGELLYVRLGRRWSVTVTVVTAITPITTHQNVLLG